ncbi:MAG: DUF11 domain-containing protein [Caldilineales bacterium]|nr:DUF11 domain-containing protein [Caldilineales bacterium]
MNHLINLLVVISLLLGSATPGLAFGGVGQSRTEASQSARGSSEAREQETNVVAPAEIVAANTVGERVSTADTVLATPPQLTLTVSQAEVEPGEAAGFTVGVSNTDGISLTQVVVSVVLPDGLTAAGEQPPFDYDAATGTLTWAVGELGPGQSASASLRARVQGKAIGDLLTSQATLTAAEWPGVLSAWAVVGVGRPGNGRGRVDGSGGRVLSKDGRVRVEIPAGAVTEVVEVVLDAETAAGGDLPGLLTRFALTAMTEAGEPVGSFARPMRAAVQLAGLEAAMAQAPGSPGFFRWDEASGQWLALASAVDWNRGVVEAELSPVGELAGQAAGSGGQVFAVAATTALSTGAQHLPTVHGFVSDEWSGNSSVSYPIELPPGPAGLGLNLSLSYSSEGVNSIRQGPTVYINQQGQTVNQDQVNGTTFNRQAGFVGWGWSLNGLGQVTVDLATGRAWLGYAGGGFELKYDAANGWQTEPQSFLRIQHSGEAWSADPWLVWAPEGTKYTFGSANWGNGMAWVYNTGSCAQQAREAHLTEVLDTHGNKVVVTYATETKGIADCGNPSYVRAIRPSRIEYIPKQVVGNESLATVGVDFGYALRDDSGVPGKTDPYVQNFWSDWRLSVITVQVRSSASVFSTVRSYELNPAGAEYVWKDQAAGQGLLVLKTIRQKGKDGGALPDWTFTYTTINGWLNHTVLASAGNGQGGSAVYSYVNLSNVWMEGCGDWSSRYRVSQLDVLDGMGTAAHNKITTIYDHQNPWAKTGLGHPQCPDFEFAGYDFVRSQVKDGGGSLQRVTDSYYHQRSGVQLDPRKGKVSLSLTSSAAGSGELARTTTTWMTATVKSRIWVYQSDVTQSVNGLDQKTAYEYQIANQGGAQYGNVTHVHTYLDAGNTLLRSQITEYFPRNDAGAAYIVNLPGRQRLLDAGGVCQGETRTWYDANTAYNQAPSLGEARKVETAQTTCGGTWSVAQFGYDAWGNQTSVTDALNNTSTTSYDTGPVGSWPRLFAYPTSTTTPLVGTTSYAWDKVLGQVTAITDPNAVVTSYEYDQWGRLWKEIEPGDSSANPTRRYTYTNYAGVASPYWQKEEQRDNLSSATPATYLEKRSFYDGLGRLVQTQAEAESSTQSIIANLEYSPLGAIKASAPYTHTTALGGYRTPDWNQPKTQTSYDALSRATQVTGPDGSMVRSYYQAGKTAVIDALNRQTISESDGLGRLRFVRQYTGSYPGQPGWSDPVYGQAEYRYDLADRLLKVIGADGAAIDLGYDLSGRKTSLTDPDMGLWSYGYDAAGNLTRQTDAKNQRTCFYYDALNRLKGKTYSTGAAACAADPGYNGYTVKYYYDKDENGAAVSNGKGRRTVMIDPSGSAKWLYGQRGKVTQETKVIGGAGGGTFVTQWSYDAAGRPVWEKYPGGNASQVGEQVNYAYTNQGLLDTVIGTATYVGDTQWNVRGQVSERWLGSTAGVVRQLYSYTTSENFRLVTLKAGNASPYTNLQNITYTYDDNGNVQTISDAAAYGGSQTQSFSYDALNRLLTAQATGGSNGAYAQRSYVYSNAGNITSFEAAALTYTDASHKHAVTHVGSVQKYWYDANGNATRRIDASRTMTLTYDVENQLTGMSGGATASYIYDGDGTRVKETSGGVTTIYIGAYFEWTGSTSTMKSYYYAGATRVAVRTGTSTGTVNYLLGDHLGSQALTLTSAGARLNTNTELRYMPYGAARYTAGTTPTSFNFTGQRKDSGSGLLFYNARWYDPAIGRFLAADTLVPSPGNPQSLNRYSYVLNNALKYVDPSGHANVCGATNTECDGSSVYPQRPQTHSGPCLSIVCLPTPTPTATPAPLAFLTPYAVMPTPYAGPWIGPATPGPTSTPTATPYPQARLGQPGGINPTDLYYTIAQGLVYQMPKALGDDVAIRALGRGGQLVLGPLGPIVGYGASVGPNLASHLTRHDPLQVTLTDVVVDSAGYGVSTGVGGIAGVVGGVLGSTEPGIGSLVGAAAGDIVGSAGGSIVWDLYVAPRWRDDIYYFLGSFVN